VDPEECLHLTFIEDGDNGMAYCGKPTSSQDIVDLDEQTVTDQLGMVNQRSQVVLCPECMRELECYTNFDKPIITTKEDN
jgi:hypothetical protein